MPERKFQNPVYGRSFPDPYILKHNGQYFAFCTGLGSDGRCFDRLRSDDLVNWTELPGAMLPLSTGEPHYWAPEITYHNGKFYLYYSVGNEKLMAIRVAVSETADGDFIDAGIELTSQEFAIDPHVFRDTDGRFYMFYATDFLDHSHIGTGTVIDEMIDPFTLKGEPRPVTRASFDWQVYDPVRKEKNGVRWHTVEGPFVFERKGVYYEMFSGGNWQNVSYGVSFAVTDDLASDGEWAQYSDGVKTLPILSTLPNRVIGPGHNSVIIGPNNRELYCIYHRWEEDERVLAIDRMDFAGDRRLFVVGPSFEPQTAPYEPHVADDFSALDEQRWTIKQGDWQTKGKRLLSGDREAVIDCDPGSESFLCSIHLHLLEPASDAGMGVVVMTDDGNKARFMLLVQGSRRFARWSNNSTSQEFDLPANTDLEVLAELSIDVDHRSVRVKFDGIRFPDLEDLTSAATRIGICSQGAPAAFSAFAITQGFEDLFDTSDLTARGWAASEPEFFELKAGSLALSALGDQAAVLTKPLTPGDFELAINVKLEDYRSGSSYLRIECSNSFVLSCVNTHWQLTTEVDSFTLPTSFSPDVSHQFRFVSRERRTATYLDADLLGSVDNTVPGDLTISVGHAVASFEMVRHTII